jgi:lysophospholipase L1-like esterase
MFTLYTFGDSILDCERYNQYGVHPGQLLVQNDDRMFPEFRGKDLRSRGPAQLEHRAVDGATVDDLPRQVRGLQAQGRGAALITIGGNDLLRGLIRDSGPGIAEFAAELDAFVHALPIRPVLLGNVYDPTFGDDARNFLVSIRHLDAQTITELTLQLQRLPGVTASWWTCTRIS